MSNYNIKFNFTEKRFSYELPLLGVDLAFVVQRKAEVFDCMQQLSKKCGEINIACKEGVADFEKANKLVRYYFDAICKLNTKERQLLGYKISLSDEQKEEKAIRMREFYKEKTI